ncbi:MAG: hypothetical protein SangKO_083460 [Sandaracinaceae bacterium]
MRERELSVSVAMCTYNGGPYIEEQLDSILRQTVQPCELVANDDGSSDDTVEILREFASRAPFPVLIEENPSNLGPTKNFERSMGRCRGDVVVISDCDDIFVPRKNEIIRDALMADPDLGCVFGDAKLIRSDGSPLGLTLWDSIEFGNEDQERFDHGDIVDALFRRTIAFGGVMGFRREILDVALPIPLPWGHDNWTALVAAALYETKLVREPLLLYRTHQAQYSGTAKVNIWEKVVAAARPPEQEKDWVPKGRSFGMLRDRLVENADRARSRSRYETVLGHAAAKYEHMTVREGLSSSALRRAATILGEAQTRRYHRYSNGLASILRDTVFGSR